jgi:outer membrane cobalamin receptor
MRAAFLSATLVASLLSAGIARADDTSQLQGLLEEEVVSTASKSEQQASDAPAFSRSLTYDDIRRYGIRSLDEAIDFLAPGVRMQKGLLSPEIGARGVHFTGDNADHVLLLVDGHVLNEPYFGSVQLGQGAGIPLELIDHIEVILGPGSAIYGSNAVLAVINVVTKSAETYKGTHVAAEVTGVNAFRTTATGGYTFEAFGRKNELVAGLTYYHQDGPAFDIPPQNIGNDPADGRPMRFSPNGPGTGFWGGRVEKAYYTYVPGAHLRFTRDRFEVIARGSFMKQGDPTNPGDFDEPRNAFKEYRASFSVKQGILLGTIGEAYARVFADFSDWRREFFASRLLACPYAGTRTCNYSTLTDAQRIGAEVQATFDWTHDGKYTTLILGTGQLNSFGSSFERKDADTGAVLVQPGDIVPQQSRSVFAVAAQQNWRPIKWLTFNGGARVDKDERFAAVFSPRVMAAVRPWDGGTLKLIHSQAFRAPSYFETYGATPVIIRNFGLDPERVRSEEAVVEQRLGAHRVALGAFYTRYSAVVRQEQLTLAEAADAVAQQRTPLPFASTITLYEFRNADQITNYGFTSAYDGTFIDGKLRFGASLTGALSDDRYGRPLTVGPRVFGNGRVSYDFGDPHQVDGLPTVALAGSFASKSVVDRGYDAGFVPIPYAPPQLDLRATVTGAVPVVKGLSYRAILNHAFHPSTPFAIGFGTKSLPTHTQPTLSPVQAWSATLGLQYDF